MTDKQVVKYDITAAEIEKMKSVYMDLTITDLEDKEEFKAVHDARMVVKGKRVEVEKKRKELKSDALAWGKKVDTEAKRIFGLMEPIESHLMSEENKVIEEQKRIQAEEEEKQRKINQDRVDELFKVGCVLPFIEIATLTDEEYDSLFCGRVQEYEAEQTRLWVEAEAVKIENERLEQIRIDQEAEAARLAKVQSDIDAKAKIEAGKLQKEKDALEAEKQAIRIEKYRLEKEAFEKQALVNARHQAKKDAEEKAEREAKEKIENEKAEAEEKKRIDALKPDKEKVHNWLNKITEIIDFEILDNIKDEDIKQIYTNTRQEILHVVIEANRRIRKI